MRPVANFLLNYSCALLAPGASCCHPAAMSLARRIGAVLLLVGGVLEAARLIVFTIVSPAWPALASIAVNEGPSMCIGAGLVAVGVWIRGRGRLPLLIAGVLYLVLVAVDIVQTVTFAPSGPGPSFLAGAAAFLTVVVAAAVLLSDRRLRGPARWALAIPAAGFVLLIVGVYAPALGSLRTDLLPGIGFAVAGVLLLRQTHPGLVPAQPVPS